MEDIIAISVENAQDVLFSYVGETDAQRITYLLIDLIHYANQAKGTSFARCVQAAQAQARKEVREQADATPLPK